MREKDYLNRMDRQIKRNVKNVMSESFLEVSENFEKKDKTRTSK